MYTIWWHSQYGVEEVDTASDLQEAEYLCREYQLAYGEGRVYYKKSRTN